MSGAAMAGKIAVIPRGRSSMDDLNPDGLTSQERAGIVATLLQDGARLTTAEVASRCGMTWRGAWKMLNTLSRSMPILCDSGLWYWLTDEPT